ncbi:hypothetical protein FACS1894137_05260 [Spirochaetia bacterium]|nr:hypothetical protein FACS1894137_05260 [Spirochaetia bacterium]
MSEIERPLRSSGILGLPVIDMPGLLLPALSTDLRVKVYMVLVVSPLISMLLVPWGTVMGWETPAAGGVKVIST